MLESERYELIQRLKAQGLDFGGRRVRSASDVVAAADDARRDELGDVVTTSGGSVDPEYGHGVKGRRVGMMDAPQPSKRVRVKAVPPKASKKN